MDMANDSITFRVVEHGGFDIASDLRPGRFEFL
jgi:hypothetical protein